MKILISAGPTIEKIDPVRFISNRSSGKMGYALAQAAIEAGHEVVLVSGPVAIEPPDKAELIKIESALEMAEAVKSKAPDCQLVIMAAAVADYRPVSIHEHKLKKTSGGLQLELERTEDILATLGKHKKTGQVLAGFAAETQNLAENALRKLQTKNLDWIFANDVAKPGQGFASENNSVTAYSSSGKKIEIPFASKLEVARRIIAILTESI
jgi:phosphopantothenoylcysteine decarboxylase/phosphopantothenate--cysteine ligase